MEAFLRSPTKAADLVEWAVKSLSAQLSLLPTRPRSSPRLSLGSCLAQLKSPQEALLCLLSRMKSENPTPALPAGSETPLREALPLLLSSPPDLVAHPRFLGPLHLICLPFPQSPTKLYLRIQ